MNSKFTQAEIDEYRSFIEDQMAEYKTDAELVAMMEEDASEPTSTEKALPKLSKAQQAAWAAVLDYNERFPGQAFWWLPGHDTRQLHALTVKGMLTRTLLSTDETFRFTIHPDYLPSEPDAAPVADTADLDDLELEDTPAPRFKVGDKVTIPASGTRTIAGVYPGAVASRWTYTFELYDGKEGIIRVDEYALQPAAELDALRARVAELETRVETLDGETEAMSGHIVALEQARDFWRTKHERALVEMQNQHQRTKRETERNILTSIEYAITRADEGKKLAAVEKVITDWSERNNLQES